MALSGVGTNAPCRGKARAEAPRRQPQGSCMWGERGEAGSSSGRQLGHWGVGEGLAGLTQNEMLTKDFGVFCLNMFWQQHRGEAESERKASKLPPGSAWRGSRGAELGRCWRRRSRGSSGGGKSGGPRVQLLGPGRDGSCVLLTAADNQPGGTSQGGVRCACADGWGMAWGHAVWGEATEAAKVLRSSKENDREESEREERNEAGKPI